jgi:hypothetical protein
MFELTKTRSKRMPRSAAQRAIGLNSSILFGVVSPNPFHERVWLNAEKSGTLPTMTRAEISALLEPATFKPFVLVTHAGRFRVPHPDFIDIPPHDAEEPEPSFIVVYTKTGAPRFVVLSSIDHIEVEPITRS